jgi:hypothetical protein
MSPNPNGPKPTVLGQDRFRRRLVKGQQLSRPRAPSIDECPLGAAFTTPRARARHPEFPGLCHPGRASNASSPPANGRLDTAAFADSSPASARRHAPLVDFCNQNRSQARPDGSTKLQAFVWGRFRGFRREVPSRPGPAGLLAKERDRGVMGQRPAFLWQCLPAPLGAIARVRRLCPNPIGSDTPCRAPVAFVAGVATTPFEHAIALRFRASRPTPAFAFAGKGRLPKPSAKKASFRRTRGAFHPRTSPWRGGAFSPHTVPSLWTTGLAPFQSSLFPAP